jgi:8-oxo-dGTP diphosphatase
MQAGGKLEPGESADAALVRELEEEVGLRVGLDRLQSLGIRDADAANEPGMRVHAALFRVDGIEPADVDARAEIDELVWVSPEDARSTLKLAPLTEMILGEL